MALKARSGIRTKSVAANVNGLLRAAKQQLADNGVTAAIHFEKVNPFGYRVVIIGHDSRIGATVGVNVSEDSLPKALEAAVKQAMDANERYELVGEVSDV